MAKTSCKSTHSIGEKMRNAGEKKVKEGRGEIERDRMRKETESATEERGSQ